LVAELLAFDRNETDCAEEMRLELHGEIATNATARSLSIFSAITSGAAEMVSAISRNV
jgi:hypothetical protein